MRPVVLALVVLLALSGCGRSLGLESRSAEWVDLGDGTEVRCVIWKLANAGGISCDWENVRPIEGSEQ